MEEQDDDGIIGLEAGTSAHGHTPVVITGMKWPMWDKTGWRLWSFG